MSGIKVMIVDDDELDRYIVKRILSNFDVFEKVAEFADGADAAEAFESEDFAREWGPPPPTLILLDINMPQMSGFEFLDHISEIYPDWSLGWEGCVILMLTSSTNSKDQERGNSFDLVKGYIDKPLDEEKVLAILEDHYRITVNI